MRRRTGRNQRKAGRNGRKSAFNGTIRALVKDMQTLIGYALLILLRNEDKVRGEGREGNVIGHLI